jgi:hypothetical protein
MKGASRLQHRVEAALPAALTPGRLASSPFPAVSVKWGKDSYDVDVDPSLPGAVFKTQMFTLTGVPPERQKFTGIKNPPLKVLAFCTSGHLAAALRPTVDALLTPTRCIPVTPSRTTRT